MKFKTLLLTAALATSMTAALAAPGDPVALLPSGPGMLSASFDQFVDEGGGVDTFTFTPDYFFGLVSVALTSLAGPVTFSVAQLNDQFFSVPDGADPYDFSFQAEVTSNMPLTLTVLRVVENAQGEFVGTGSYNVNVAVTPAVPEPQTWAMLFCGLFAVAAASKMRTTPGRVRRPKV